MRITQRERSFTMTNETPAASSCCSTSAAPAAPATTASVGAASPTVELADDMTTCPVMVGTPTSKSAAEAKGLYRDFEGTRYWFCCPGCAPRFDSDPVGYAANMAQ